MMEEQEVDYLDTQRINNRKNIPYKETLPKDQNEINQKT